MGSKDNNGKVQCDICDETKNNFVRNKNNRNDSYSNTFDNKSESQIPHSSHMSESPTEETGIAIAKFQLNRFRIVLNDITYPSH
jgi:transcription elongation factor Elf1